MKRFTGILLAAAALLSALCGCSDNPKEQSIDHPFLFYYARTQVSYDDSGVIGTEEREFDPQTEDAAALVQDYFSGPVSSELTLTFPSDTCATNCYSDGGTVYLTLNSGYSRMSGVSKSVAEACLAKTLLQLPKIERVCIRKLNGESVWLRESDIVLSDGSAQVQDTVVTLYFADADCRYLVAEQRSAGAIADDALPEYIVRQLMAGTEQRGLVETIPEQAGLRSVRVNDGVCIVDFTVEFLTEKPATHMEERMLVYSIVDSLTELEAVDAVEIRADGESIGRYVQMDLTESFARNEAVIGPVKTASGEIDATLCVGGEYTQLLLCLPTRIAVPEDQNGEAAVLAALLQFQPYNAYYSVIPEGTEALSVTVRNGVCFIDFNQAFLSGCADSAALSAAVASVVGTMTSLEGIDGVQINVEGSPLPWSYDNQQFVINPEEAWFADGNLP